ncbi:hypothetical protein M0D69_16840 [Caballeronia sp. SEWSISQ10-4 2]|uniref:hypothetical protein n=1 Tax=Caballeronia sp. SEWSISQ10-4 2 TaxID=2937438 RepID=UPI00264C27BE|nr:hypothetical protein [Caballeronia sp. SEWSISQ10-4 2]MDN7179624.1 hypothetical protein [Caballeronia sp. SEWSISQ10-4 2]
MKIHLHIERLVLDGTPFGNRDAQPMQAAIETELQRLLAVHGVTPGLQRAHQLDRLSAAPIRPAAGDGPRAWGRSIARSLHGGIAS